MSDASIHGDAPVADWFDQTEMLADPYRGYARLRALGPVVNVPGIKRYPLTTHASVTGAEQHPNLFSAHSSNNTMVRAVGGRPMLRKNDPEHSTERGAINPTLRPRAVGEGWAPRFRVAVEHWLDNLAEVGPDAADLNTDFAGPVAAQNLIELVGFPSDVDVHDMWRWSADFIAGIANLLDDPEVWARCDRSRAETSAILDALLPRLAHEPDVSVTSHLQQAGLPEEVVRTNVNLTISGGMNEPQHMITNFVWALSQRPDQLDLLRDGQVAWGDAFEETVRWLSPIGMLPRETTQDVDWFGSRIPRASLGRSLLACANRDTAVFDNADEYDVRRVARGHLAFGSGTHTCAGRWAAKASVGEIAVPTLEERFPDLRVDERRPATWDGWVFRGLTSLPVTW